MTNEQRETNPVDIPLLILLYWLVGWLVGWLVDRDPYFMAYEIIPK